MEKLILLVVLYVGIPAAKFFLPSVPNSIWEGIVLILKHVMGADEPQAVADDFHAKTKECVGVACPSGVISE